MYTSTARRNVFVRSVATVTGDVAIGFALASACVWIIQSAALGLFLSFLLWLLTIALALALSQYALHPAVNLLLSDRKLDQGLAVLSEVAHVAGRLSADLGAPTWQQVRRSLTRFVGGHAAA